jgi:3-deoxy-7-phosphoheptulonate synthase
MEAEKLKLVLNKKRETFVKTGKLRFGKDFILIAGPCSVESEEQILKIAKAVKESGANILRGGAFKPRTSPYDFQGLGEEGLKILKKASRETELPVITEVLDTRDMELVCEYADILQIGSRNMQNYALLKEVGKINKPVLLKRGMNSTINEWLNAAEYILSNGNKNIVLCERGIRTFDPEYNRTLDLNSIPIIKSLTDLPIIVDPSHGTGNANSVGSMSLAAIAAGADGLMIEVHNNPEKALSDKKQQLSIQEFTILSKNIFEINKCINNKIN